MDASKQLGKRSVHLFGPGEVVALLVLEVSDGPRKVQIAVHAPYVVDEPAGSHNAVELYTL
jgi:hypothetical protein